MCPICITTAALAASGSATGGGLLAILLRRIRNPVLVLATALSLAGVDQAGEPKTLYPRIAPVDQYLIADQIPAIGTRCPAAFSS
jgi:hypothetical protein